MAQKNLVWANDLPKGDQDTANMISSMSHQKTMKEQKIQRPLIKVAAFIKDFWRLWGGICLGFAWQAWHLWHWAGSGGVLGRAWSPVTPRHFARQAWHLLTSTFILRGRRGTWWHPPSSCVAAAALCLAGVAQRNIHRRFAWQAWNLVAHKYGTGLALVGRLGGLGRRWRCGTLRGKRGTWRPPPSFHVARVAVAWFCVAGVALMALGWLWWRAWAGLVAGDAAALCVAVVALGDLHLRFAWQAWQLEASTLVLRGRCGTYGTGLALVARLGGLGRRWRRGTLRGRRWHLLTSTFILRGRRGTWWHPPSLMALRGALGRPGRRWRRGILRGRRGTWWHPPSFYVVGVALVDIHLRFAWQACNLWHCVARLYGLVAGDAEALCVAGVALMALGWLWCHTPSLSHTIFHTPLCHPPSLTHHRSHTTLSHTIFDPQLFHTPSFTHRKSHQKSHHLSHTTLSHTIFHTTSSQPSLTHDFVTHHLSHTIFDIPSFTHHRCPTPTPFLTHLCHTPFFTPNFFTHHLWHAIFHTPLCHTPLCITPSFTHHFVTHHLSSFTHNFVAHQLCHTPPFTHNFHTHHLSHTTLFYFSILHHLLCLSFFPRPRYNISCSLLEKLPCIRSFNF